MIHMALPENQAVLAAVGAVAIRHGQLDYFLRMAIRSLADVTIDEALDSTARFQSRELRERVRKLARKRLGEGQALVRLDALLQRASDATRQRNELLHALWAKELDGDHVIRNEGREFRPIPSVQDLNEAAESLRQIGDELNMARLNGFLKDAIERAPVQENC